MISRRAILSASRITAALLLVAAAACAPASTRIRDHGRMSEILDSLAGPSVAGVPQVMISTDDDMALSNRIITRLRVEEPAYVAVVNVSPGGTATVIFPERPEEPALLLGGKTYVMPSHFTGYHWTAVPPAGAQGTRMVWYGRSSTARISAKGPGYIFVIASRFPLNLDALADEGYFDGIEVGGTLADLEPESVIPRIATVALAGSRRGGVSVDYARYSGYDPVAYVASAFRSSSNTSNSAYCGSGYDALDSYSSALRNRWNYDFARGGCSPLAFWLFGGRTPGYPVPGVPPTPPTKPVPPDSGSTVPPDTGSATPPTQKPRPLFPLPADDTVRAATSLGERRIVSSEAASERALRPERLPIARDEVVLTHAERQRAVENARARLRAGLDNDAPRPFARQRARPAADRPATRDRNPDPRVTAGSVASQPERSSPPPATRSAEPPSAPATRGEGAPKPEPVPTSP